MPSVLWVINAGSSSVKLSVYADEEPPRLLVRARLEELSTRPRIVVRSASGPAVEKSLPLDMVCNHEGAIEHLFALASEGALGDGEVVAVGHRVVHGGHELAGPVRIDK